MALTPKQAFDLTQSEAFTARLQFLLGKYAKYCQASTDTGAGQAGRPASKALASRIQSDSGGMTGKIAVSLVSNSNIVAAATIGTQGQNDYDLNVLDSDLNGWLEGEWNSGVWDSIT